MNKRLVLFDFDGTITTKDSLADFIQFSIGKPAYYQGLFLQSPMLIAYKLKIIPNDVAKEKFIGSFFKGWDEEKFRNLAIDYSIKKIDSILRPGAIEKMRWHQDKGDRVAVVSASIECWLKPWCEKNGIELLSTRLEMREGKLTGKFSTKNCYGAEKAYRVRERFDLEQYTYITAYGDSRGDKELLELADESHYRPFRK